jgi:hypothetical protein
MADDRVAALLRDWRRALERSRAWIENPESEK